MFVMCLPGLAPLVRRQLNDLHGITATGDGFDGRADVVLFGAGRGHRGGALALRTAEDVFVEVGRADRAQADDPRRIAAAIWRPQPVQRALSVWAEQQHPLAGSMTFRVITRVLSESTFRRTELRRQLTEAVRRDRRRWTVADPAELEIWACEYRPGRFVAGLRLTDVRMRQHGGRSLERPGALRPTLAAAMVDLAGQPPGMLLDPCCGSGSILAEAVAAGWTATGLDIDPSAVAIARGNAAQASVHIGDARRMSLPDASATACVTNLPFGRQYRVQGKTTPWLAAVLEEIARVTRPGGRVVLLAPEIPSAALPRSLQPAGAFPVRLLGRTVTTWSYRRLSRSRASAMTGLLRNVRPQPQLGQSFLMEGRILEREIDYARVGAEDTVLEVGAGIGNLTERLARRAGQVIAIEYDQQFRPRLDSLARAHGNITPLWGDALAVPLPPFSKVVSNLPYRVALPIILRLLDYPFASGVVMLQENMAGHICAGPGEASYGRISVTIQRLARTQLLDSVPRSAFSPAPSVDSAIVGLWPVSRPFGVASAEAFKRLLDHAFLHREDRLSAALGRQAGTAAVAPLLPGKLRGKRVSQLTPEEFGEVSRFLDAHKVRLSPVSDVAKRTAQKPRKRPGNS
jgi:ribosomal RNA small subunit methyltransferase A